jgi:hypothetical protein
MVGPGLLPGRVLSSADIWWFSPPWAAQRPAGLDHPANPDLEDAARAFQPLREEVKRQLPGAPLWDPWIASGRPLLADAQSAVFSPFNLPAWVLPLQRSLAWTALLILWAASFGMYGLGRALGMRFAGALLAGIVYGLNLWLVSHLSYPHAGVWALLPWLLWASDRLVRRPDATAVALLAAVVALQYFAGHPETSFHVVLATVAFFALRLGQARQRGLRAPLLAMAAALAAGTGLAAIMLAPFGELLLHSADLAERSGTGIGQHDDPTYLLGFFLYDYWGRATHTALTPLLFSRAWYVGALPLMLAAAALILRPRAERLWIAGAALLLLAVIFGLPPFAQIATRLPLLSLGHNDRLIIIPLACLALLAGFGLDDLSGRASGLRRRRRALLLTAAAILLLPLLMVAGRHGIDQFHPGEAVKVAFAVAAPPSARDPSAADVIRAGTVVLWVCLAGTGLALLVLRLRGLRAATFAGLALTVVAVDLLRAGMGYNPAIATDRARQPLTGALRYLAGHSPQRFAGVGNTVPQNVAALRFRIQDARGNDPPVLERYNRLWRREISPEYPNLTATITSPFLQVPRLDERRLRALRLLGVGYLLAPPRSAGPSPPGLDSPGLTPVYDGPDARVLRVDGALPRAFVAAGQRPVDGGRAALDATTRPGLDRRRVAVTEKRLPGLPASGRPPPAGSARIVSYKPDRVTIDAQLSRPGLIVLGDNWYPGWKAKLDGKPAATERVDYTLRGTPAGPGHHRLEYHYQPASWRIGWILSLLTLAALATALLLGRRRRRAGPGTGTPDEGGEVLSAEPTPLRGSGR